MYFTEEHEAFRLSFKEFLQKEVVPHIEKWEKTGTIERFIWKKFGEMGILSTQKNLRNGFDLFVQLSF
jgi:alkylation response protein AidB-like acyl-CoA dehydrogenase